MARTSNTVLNKSSESEYPCLFPGFRGCTFRFAPLNMMLAVDFSYVAYIMLRCVYSGVLAWRIPGTGEPGGLPSMGLHRVGHD